MIETIAFRLNTASATEMVAHLTHCDLNFVPPLSSRVEISAYAAKIASSAIRCEAWSQDSLIGLVAAYCNDQNSRIGYITSVSVSSEWTGKGIATRLMQQCIAQAALSGMSLIKLEVARDNTQAISLYKKLGFCIDQATTPSLTMTLHMNGKEQHEQHTRP